MEGYTKLAASIITSTVWRAPDHVRLVWITMLALKSQHGAVMASVPGLAALANVSIEACEQAIAHLSSPDRYSQTKTHEGRRIAENDGGWLVLNHEKYRQLASADERRARDAERKRVKRASAGQSAGVRRRPQASENVPEVRASDADQSKSKSDPPQPRAASAPARAPARTNGSSPASPAAVTAALDELEPAPEPGTFAELHPEALSVKLADLMAEHLHVEAKVPQVEAIGPDRISALRWLAERPLKDLAVVCATLRADPWIRKRPSRGTPEHIRKQWAKYAAGPEADAGGEIPMDDWSEP